MNRLLTIISLLACSCLIAQTEDLLSLPLDTIYLRLESQIHDLNEQTKYEEFMKSAYAVLDKAKREGDPTDMAQVHKIIGDAHYYSVKSNNPDSVYFHDNQILEYLKLTDDQAKIAKAHDRVGKDLSSLGRFTEAEQQLFEAVRIYEALEDQKQLASSYSSLNALYRSSKDYEQALSYGEKSLELIEKYQEEETDLIEPLLGLIKTYPEVGRADLALPKAQQVVDIIRRTYGDEDNVHMANVRSWRGEVYVALEEYDKAYHDFYYSWNVIKTIVSTDEEADGWKGDIGNTLRLQGQYAQAIPWIKDALVHHQERNINTWDRVENYQFWIADCYANLNQPDSATIYLSRARQLENDRLTAELEAVKKELRVKYDMELKEATISTQEAQIVQQKKTQYLSYGIGALLLALLGGVYYTYRNNRQKNQLLQSLNSDLTNTNEQLDVRNAQNELLLKEIHHRVKNNLEVVSSLLELQSAQIDDKGIKDAMQEGQNRVQSIGIVHQKLYQGQNLGAIEMKDYFVNLSESILDSFGARDRVTIECAMDQLDVDIDTAVPLGLIVNELLTNTLKYAFPDKQDGKVRIKLARTNDDTLQLEISDNGIGKSDVIQGTGFGGQLISLLTTQLSGTLREEVRDGTTIYIDFNMKKAG